MLKEQGCLTPPPTWQNKKQTMTLSRIPSQDFLDVCMLASSCNIIFQLLAPYLVGWFVVSWFFQTNAEFHTRLCKYWGEEFPKSPG